MNSLIDFGRLFKRGVFPAYKDANVSLKQLVQWVRLSICFEQPPPANAKSKPITPGSLYIATVPLWVDSFYEGVVVLGFGLEAKQLSIFRKYYTHEWLVDVRLGKETVDTYFASPLVAHHKHEHVTKQSIKDLIPQFIGEIEQVSPYYLYQEWKDSNLEKQRNNVFQPDNSFTSDDELDEVMVDQTVETDLTPENYVSKLSRFRNCRVKHVNSIEVSHLIGDRLQFKVISDGLFSCRGFVRDIGQMLNCPSCVERLQLVQCGPYHQDRALAKHELHFNQIVESIQMNTQLGSAYNKQLAVMYPDLKSSFRYI